MKARTKFKKQDRVRLTARGRAMFYKTDPERRGTVVGFSVKDDCVSIVVDGNKPSTRTTYHMSYWEVDVCDECNRGECLDHVRTAVASTGAPP